MPNSSNDRSARRVWASHEATMSGSMSATGPVLVDSVPVDPVPVDSVPVDPLLVDSVPVDRLRADRAPSAGTARRSTERGSTDTDLTAFRAEPLRPATALSPFDRGLAWLGWFGVARLLAAALCVLTIAGGIWWLLRAPALPAEQLLPATNGSQPSSTLAVARSSPVTTNAAAPTVIVHVAGQVVSPGVYKLAADSRVIDAVAAAGGVTAAGDTEALNLAAVIADGARIYVPTLGEVDPATVSPTGAPSAGAAGSQPGTPININTADQAELETLPGVGPATAAAIVEDRTRNGPFASVDDLDRVAGIGPAKLESLRDLVVT